MAEHFDHTCRKQNMALILLTLALNRYFKGAPHTHVFVSYIKNKAALIIKKGTVMHYNQSQIKTLYQYNTLM